jgi:hypothetical protein
MTKIWVLILGLISSPTLAQNMTADAASSKQLAIEIQFCAAYFKAMSSCHEEKNLPPNFSTEAKTIAANIVRRYDEEALKALNNVSKIMKAYHLSNADMDTRLIRASNQLMAEANYSCTNIRILEDKYAPVCNPLVRNPLLRLKALSECTHKDKVGC